MSTNIQYTSTPEPNPYLDILLVEEFTRYRRLIPMEIRLSYVKALYHVSMWLLGYKDFDTMIDCLGVIADNLKNQDQDPTALSGVNRN